MTTLPEVLALLDKATPGEVMLATGCSWRRILTVDGSPWLVPCIASDGHPDMHGTDNAEAAVAAVNYLRANRDRLLRAAAMLDAVDSGEWNCVPAAGHPAMIVDLSNVLRNGERAYGVLLRDGLRQAIAAAPSPPVEGGGDG